VSTSNATTQEPRWRRLPEERPRQIIEAALETFAERGLANARLDDIAKRAGLSKGTIYLYFPNKEELFREVVRQTIVANIEAAEREIEAADGPVADAFARFIRGYWAFARDPHYVAIFRLVNAELHNFPDLVEFYADEAVMRSRRLVQRLIERGIASGEFRPVDVRVAARMVTSSVVMHALWTQASMVCSRVLECGHDQLVQDIVDYHLHALRAGPRAV
jgi:AcrR family transcriptional regulator